MRKISFGSAIKVKIDGDIAAPTLTVIDVDSEECYKTCYKTAWIYGHGFVPLTEAYSGDECFSDDHRLLAVYGKIVLDFSAWFNRGGAGDKYIPCGDPVDVHVPTVEEADQILKSSGIPVQPVEDPQGNPYDKIAAAVGLPEGGSFDEWISKVKAVEEIVKSAKGPLVELCDGRFVRAADLTEDDKNLIADPHDSPHNAAIVGGDTYRDGKWFYQNNPPDFED